VSQNRVAVLAVLLALSSSSPAWSACMSAERPAAAEGRLVSGRFTDAAGRPESAFILQLSSPVCLEGSDEFDKVANARAIHVFSATDTIGRRLRTFVGKDVRVRGTPFGAHTAHHHAPIVMDVSEIGPR
jgi:Domain of unknown function (DUF4431)